MYPFAAGADTAYDQDTDVGAGWVGFAETITARASAAAY